MQYFIILHKNERARFMYLAPPKKHYVVV